MLSISTYLFPTSRIKVSGLLADYKVLVLGTLRLNILRAYKALPKNKHLPLIFEAIGQ